MKDVATPRKFNSKFTKSRFEAQKGRCFYCHIEMAPRLADNDNKFHNGQPCVTQDHVIPVSKGGRKGWMNKVLACKKCNEAKANRMPTDEELERFKELARRNPPLP